MIFNKNQLKPIIITSHVSLLKKIYLEVMISKKAELLTGNKHVN